MAAGQLMNFADAIFPGGGERLGERLVDFGLEMVTGKKQSKFMLETLQKSLKLLSEKEYDIAVTIRHGERSGKNKRGREAGNWLKSVKKFKSDVLQNQVREEGFLSLSRFFGEDPVSELNAQAIAFIDQSRHLIILVPDASAMKGKKMMISSLITCAAFGKNIEDIYKWLVTDKVKSITIYGIPEVGKTALAKGINNRLLEETQLYVYYISVPQPFTIKKLQSDMAKEILLDLSDEENVDKRAWTLNQALSQKKCALILDDVRSDIDLEHIGDPLGVKGCRLIVTTSCLRVCQRIDCERQIQVETLRTHDSWTLFRKALGKTTINSYVEGIAKLVAEKCDGVPPRIIKLATSMRTVTDICVWRNVYNDLCKSPYSMESVLVNLEYLINVMNSTI